MSYPQGYPGYPQTGNAGGYPSPYHATSQLSYPGYPSTHQSSSYPSHASPMYPLNPTPGMYPPAPTQSPFSTPSGYPPSNSSPYPSVGFSQNTGPGYPGSGGMPQPSGGNNSSLGFSQVTNSGYAGNNNMPPYPSGGNNPSPYPTGGNYPSPYPTGGNNNPAPYPSSGNIFGAPTSFNTPPQPPYNPMGSAPTSFNTAPAQLSYNSMGSAPTSFNSQPPLPYDPRYPAPFPSNSGSQPPYNPAGAGLYPQLQTQTGYSGVNGNTYDSQTRASYVATAPVAAAAYSASAGMQGYNVVQPKGTPTLRPHAGFSPRQDAETLRRAMKGFGTDEQAIITVLARRTNDQRLQIAVQFKTLYGKDLNKELKSELSGRFEEVVLAMMMPLPQFYAQELRKSVQGLGTDEAAIIEVLCSHDNHYIRTIRSAYESMYRTSLERDMGGDTSGHFKRLLVSLCLGNRDESVSVDAAACSADAQALHRAGALRLGTDESTFNGVLCSRSYAHLRRVFAEYERLAGHSMEQAVRSEFSGDIEAGLLAIVKCVRNTPGFFAERLHTSMSGLGTKDRTLIRIIVTRAEVDMADIKREFQARYHKTLESFVAGDTSGDYKKCLIALIT